MCDVHACMHDFEAALIKTIGMWFRCKHQIGCFFHWKQALRGKMVDMKFNSEVIKETLPMFDFLTVVKKGHIRKGVECIQENANKVIKLKKDDRILFGTYLDEYFIPFWLQQRMKDMYNYNDSEDWKKDMWKMKVMNRCNLHYSFTYHDDS